MPGAELDHGLILIGKDAKNRPARCCEEATMQTANLNASDHLPLPWLSVPPTPFAAEDEARAPGAPRPLSFCGLRSKSLLWLAAVTLAGDVGAVLQLAQQRRSRSEGA